MIQLAISLFLCNLSLKK